MGDWWPAAALTTNLTTAAAAAAGRQQCHDCWLRRLLLLLLCLQPALLQHEVMALHGAQVTPTTCQSMWFVDWHIDKVTEMHRDADSASRCNSVISDPPLISRRGSPSTWLQSGNAAVGVHYSTIQSPLTMYARTLPAAALLCECTRCRKYVQTTANFLRWERCVCMLSVATMWW
jgi:hypothetical protein